MCPNRVCLFIILSSISLAVTAFAQENIVELTEQAGIEAGGVKLRDMPGWRPPQKIVLRNIGLPLMDLQALMPGVEIVEVRNADDAIANANGADAIIGWCSERVIAAATDAIWAQIFGAGVDRCMATERIANGSVVLTNMQKMSSPFIAEHVIAMTLGLARRLPHFAKKMPKGEWRRTTDVTGGMQSIAGKTMLVVGLGGIGTEVARRAAALDMRVIGTRRSSREGPDFVDYVGLAHELHALAAEADFVVVTLPWTTETEGLLDREFFMAVKKGAHIINVGRGAIIVTDDLIAALESGQIAGAALDVTDPEPLPADHPLWQMDNVLITPHVSSRGGNGTRHAILLRENLRRFVTGDALLNVVDPELGY